MFRKPVRLMLYILFTIAILTACTAPTPAPSITPIPTAIPKPTATNTSTPTQPPVPNATSGMTQPSKLGYHAAAYDIKADRVVVFGGQIDETHGLTETWTYDLASSAWAKMSPAKSPGMGEGQMAYDSASDRTIYYTGYVMSVPNDLSTFAKTNQTWAYDYNTDTWIDLQANGTPSGLLGARIVYDTKADRMVLFGGMDLNTFSFYNDTWVYDFNTNTWTNMHPTTSPPGQNFFQMDYDAASDRLLAWIKPDTDGSNNMWAYDLTTNTWTSTPITEPAYRPYGAMVYVPTVKLDFVFGGVTPDTETPYDDMWTYNAVTNTWEQVPFTSGPNARGWHTMSYSTKSDRIVLIGGGATKSSWTNEVWIFDPQGKTWTQVGPK